MLTDLPLVDGGISIDVLTDPETTWSATLQFVHSETTAWGVNANGQTYGTPNENGMPDLTPARATNCRIGWVYTTDMFAPGPASSPDHYTIPVYESDGTTQIGEFPFGNNLDLPECPK